MQFDQLNRRAFITKHDWLCGECLSDLNDLDLTVNQIDKSGDRQSPRKRNVVRLQSEQQSAIIGIRIF